VEKLILVIGSNGQLALSFKKICPKETKFLSSKELDLTNIKKINQILSFYKPKYIFNFAAYNKVDDAEKDKKNILINAEAVKEISNFCSEKDIFFLHVSTDYVFDGSIGNYCEEDNPSPINAYGSAKLKGENYIREICKKYIIIRTAWLYSNGKNNFLDAIRSQFSDQKVLKGANDIIGSPTSSDSLAEGILMVYKKMQSQSLSSGIYHFANKGRTSKLEFVRKINKLLSKKINCKERKVISVSNSDFDLKADRPYDTSLNVNKFESEFGFIIPDWNEELTKIIEKI